MQIVVSIVEKIIGIASIFVVGRIIRGYFEIFYIRKTKSIWRAMPWILFFVWQFVFTCNNGIQPYIHIIVVVLLVYFIGLCTYIGNAISILFTSIAFATVWGLIEFIIGYALITLGIDYQIQLLEVISSTILLYLFIMSIKKFYQNKYVVEMPKKYNILLLSIPLGSLFTAFTIFRMSSSSSILFDIICAFVCVIIIFIWNMLIYIVYIKISEELETKKCNIVLQKQLEICDKYIKEKERELDMMEIRKARHDMKQSYIFISSLLEKKNYRELQSYINELIGSTNITKAGIAFSDNAIVDSLLNNINFKAQSDNIEVIVDLQIPKDLPFPNADLCVLIGNALDNALEANRKLENDVHRYISVKMKYDSDNLMISVKNSFDGIVRRTHNNSFVTTKEDKKNHGFGLQSIQRIVNKYNGVLITKYDNSVFLLKLLLYSPTEKLQVNQ